jgi:hypothetical protein
MDNQLKTDMRKELLYLAAKKRFAGQPITPCGLEKSLHTCFKENQGRLMFWYNIGKNTYSERE